MTLSDSNTPSAESNTGRVRFRIEWPALAIVTVFAIVMMYPFTLGGKALMPDTWKSILPWAQGQDINENLTSIYDPVLEYGPWFEYSQQCLKEGRLPHWNPWQFCGAPLYANRLVPFFFPPFLLSMLIAHPHKLLGWFQLFNLMLSGWGMYFLLRRWRMSPAVSSASSCLYLTCGIHFLAFPVWTLGTIGFPWLLWSLEGFLEKPGLKPVAVSGIIAGMILMVGYPVLVVQLTYFTAIYFLARWWMTKRLGPGRLHWSIPPLILLAVFVLGLGVSAIANVPTHFYSRQTVRAIDGFTDKAFEQEKRMLLATEEEAGMNPLAVRFGERADILLPINGRGTQRAWQYGGVLLYLLAFLGILSWRPRARLLGILGLLFALVVWIPEIYIWLISILPGWGVTILLPIEVINLIACMLAAYGIESLLDRSRLPGLIGRIIFVVLAIAGILLTYRYLRNAPVVNLPILISVPEKNFLATSPFHVFYFWAIAILATVAATLVNTSGRLNLLRWSSVVAVILFSAIVFHYQQPVYSQRDYQPSTSFTEWFDSTIEQPGRIARWADLSLPFNPHKRTKSPFIPNLHLLHGARDAGGYDSLVPSRYIEYCTLFEDAFMDYRALIAFRAPDSMHHPRFRALGIRWIICQGEIPIPGRQGLTLVFDSRDQPDAVEPIQDNDFIQVWEVIDPRPRAFLTRRIAFSNDPFDDPLVQAVNLAVREIDAVVVEDPEEENRTFAFPLDFNNEESLVLPGGEVEFIVDDPEYVRISCSASVESYLVLRDGWFPEWEAWLDGEKTTIYPADKAFRAVKIPPGEHIVEFRYVPRSFVMGSWITLAFIVILFLMGLTKIPASKQSE